MQQCERFVDFRLRSACRTAAIETRFEVVSNVAAMDSSENQDITDGLEGFRENEIACLFAAGLD